MRESEHEALPDSWLSDLAGALAGGLPRSPWLGLALLVLVAIGCSGLPSSLALPIVVGVTFAIGGSWRRAWRGLGEAFAVLWILPLAGAVVFVFHPDTGSEGPAGVPLVVITLVSALLLAVRPPRNRRVVIILYIVAAMLTLGVVYLRAQGVPLTLRSGNPSIHLQMTLGAHAAQPALLALVVILAAVYAARGGLSRFGGWTVASLVLASWAATTIPMGGWNPLAVPGLVFLTVLGARTGAAAAKARSANSTDAADRASARLVVRCHRRPWFAAATIITLGTLLSWAVHGVTLAAVVGVSYRSTAYLARDSWWLLWAAPTPTLLATVLLFHLSWTAGGLVEQVAAYTMVAVVPLAAGALLGEVTQSFRVPAFLGLGHMSWEGLLVGWAPLLVGLAVGRRTPPTRAHVVDGMLVLLSAALVAGFSIKGESTPVFWLAPHLLYPVLLHRLATVDLPGRVLLHAGWSFGFVAGIVATTQHDAFVGTAESTLAVSFLWWLSTVTVVAARRVRGMSVVPATHPIVADWSDGTTLT